MWMLYTGGNAVLLRQQMQVRVFEGGYDRPGMFVRRLLSNDSNPYAITGTYCVTDHMRLSEFSEFGTGDDYFPHSALYRPNKLFRS